MPKMPKLETLHPLALVETADQLRDMLAPLPLTKNQVASMTRHLAAHLPAKIQIDQRTPKSVATVTIKRHGQQAWRVRVNNRAHISLPDML